MTFGLAFDLQGQIQGQGIWVPDNVPKLRQHVYKKWSYTIANIPEQLSHNLTFKVKLKVKGRVPDIVSKFRQHLYQNRSQ